MSTLTGTKSHSTIFNARGIAQIGIISAISTVLMLFDIPLWFAPSFYTIDLSDIPILIGSFAVGPLAGVMMELIKNLIHLVLSGTTTGGIGEFANFLIGCSLVLPSAVIYHRGKSKKQAVIGLAAGTVCITVIACTLNAYVLLPVYASAFHMPLEALVAIGTKVNPSIKDLTTFILLAVAPFNILKGVMASVITLLLYKKVSPILHR
jgi:riboflavin transporter FmnP